ncbi:MAG: HNH endonuclease [Pirellulaceae bacterium]
MDNVTRSGKKNLREWVSVDRQTTGAAMQFHEYRTLRSHWARQTHEESLRKLARKMTTSEFREFMWQRSDQYLQSARPDDPLLKSVAEQAFFAGAEKRWVELERPFYNFWPVAVSLAAGMKLDVPMRNIEFPFRYLLLRFAKGHEPHGMAVAMLRWLQEVPDITVCCWFTNSPDALAVRFGDYKPDDPMDVMLKMSGTFEDEWLDKERLKSFDPDSASKLVVHLAAFISLLWKGNDIVTPVVLSKDESKYDSAGDREAQKWLEDRARRKLGRGFDVGKQLEHERERSPHWRNPHLALFWTGEGRNVPVIKMRRGSVVQKASMADVPTGFLGPETEADDQLLSETRQDESLSRSKRFDIFKRDEYRCQLCGRTQEEGVKLHVDHKVPRAKGGSNEDSNLWTLCEACNLGKSDKDLDATPQEPT